MNNSRTEHRLKIILIRLLWIGVLTSTAVVIVGGIMYLISHQNGITDFRTFSSEPDRLRYVHSILFEAWLLHGRAVIQTGLLIMLATPIMRVFLSLITFLIEGDFVYALISLIVIALLLIGLLSGYLTE